MKNIRSVLLLYQRRREPSRGRVTDGRHGAKRTHAPPRPRRCIVDIMPPPTINLTAAVEAYFADLRRIRASGGATPELSFRTPLENLLDAVGGSLKPKVSCVGEMANQGAGRPDFGLYTAKQSRKGQTPKDQKPECGVVEVKPFGDDAWLTAESGQVSKYWAQYRLVLVTNYRDFVLLGEDAEARPAKLETFRLTESTEEFEKRLEHPRAFAKEKGTALGEYLRRALSHRAAIAEPRDLAQLLASYARDGLARVEAAGDAPSLAAVRSALEEALDVSFEDERGVAFFRSTLVQTLFYGIFSAWVLWSRQEPPPTGSFNWRESVWHLRVPVLRALFQQISDPGRLRPLGLVKVLDWTAAALDRVDRAAFFERFDEGKAVTYFYEPFLEAFDPDLRKQLGVWYTPAEVVRYMVARVDRALKNDLGIADGLAADNVYVLDPCCGTGAYLAETLRRIAANLEGRGLGALTGAAVKRAATERVFGFEIMPAPFVVAHLQVGLTMQALDAPLAKDGSERAGVYLTNALTGWDERSQSKLDSPEFQEERDLAEDVKQEKPVLVVLGNPPYNGFAGMAVDEERALSTAYRDVKQVRKPEGQGLNDLYVRFFRMAERRIAEKRAEAWSASSPTTPGSTASPSPACGSATWRRSTRFASTICTATASSRSTPPMDGLAKRSLRSRENHRASRSAQASHCYRSPAAMPTHRRTSASATAISTRRGPPIGGGRCSTAFTLQESTRATWLWSRIAGSACRSNQWRSATVGMTGRRCLTCSRWLSRVSRLRGTDSSSISISTGLRRG